MAEIFIGYASKDRARVEPLAKALHDQDQSWSVFWDLNILPADKWRDVLKKELGSAKCIVVIWTRTSVSSDYVLDEAEEGKRRNVLIPVLMDPIDRADIPLGFGQRPMG
ncbi:MAG: toll/interleukin-1 receptor domain-containing protein [Nitrospirae bacterium]|nr:toll/interleukin-1 receptor domain-containing protein [Nitrospirota bacterium]